MKNISRWLFMAALTGLVACHKSSNNKFITTGTDTTTAVGTDTTLTVYAAGWSTIGSINTATVWKNDTATLLPPAATADTGSFGYSVAVSGTDVYVAGNSPHGAVVWKNGQPTILSPELEAAASWVTIAGSDVYVCGYGVKAGTYARAMYWKNAAEVWMNPDTACSSSQILVQDTDVYVTGTLNATAACYWKNGQLVVLPSGSQGATAGGIAIVGNDIYIAGTVYNPSIANYNAVYWKNGKMVSLNNAGATGDALIYSLWVN